MKKLLLLLTCILSVSFSFSQIRYDDGPIGDTGTVQQFTISGTFWDHRIITYFFSNTTNDFNQFAAREAVREALRTWQAQTRLYFIEVCNAGSADIVISWAVGNHGDGYPFDGQNGVLAHAFYPPPNSGALAGDIHFDDDENWTNVFQYGWSQPIDLQTVALHEIGHSLGLAHSTVANSVMYRWYIGSHRSLEQDDIDGIRSIYGSPVGFIVGPDAMTCSASYSIAETIPSGHTLTWSTNSSLVTVAQNGTVTNNGYTGAVTLTATVSNSCGVLTFTKEIQVTPGQGPGPYSFTPYWTQGGVTTYMDKCNKVTDICGNTRLSGVDGAAGRIFSLYSYCASGYIIDPTATSITWSVYQRNTNSHTSYSFNGNQFSVYINLNYPNDWIKLMCTRTNSCGSAYDIFTFYAAEPRPAGCYIIAEAKKASDEPGKINIYPNPATGQFNVALQAKDKASGIKEVIIKNKMGTMVYHQKFNNNQTQQTINLFNKPADIYMVEVFDGKEWTTQKLILQR